MDLDRALAAAIGAARDAGCLLREGSALTHKTFQTKSNRHDLVTEFDRRAETLIVERLRRETPEHGIVSEEGASKTGSSGAAWVIDPLDGTSNFTNGIPHFATSIGLMHGDEPLVGCVYDPMRDELFTAISGRGAWRNDADISVSHQTVLDGAVLGVGFSIQADLRTAMLAIVPRLVPWVRAWRTTGSAALDLAYVACGRFDAAWYLSLHPWDIAAGAALIREAGGEITSLDGAPLRTPHEQGVLASNSALHRQIIDVVGGDT